MQLGTFGAILSFSIELETQAADYYEAAFEIGIDPIYSKMAKGARKRVKRLERTRRELVAEMILESITGLDDDNYSINPKSSSNPDVLLSGALTIENNARQFYKDAEVKMPIKEVSRIFNRLARENDRNITQLEKSL